MPEESELISSSFAKFSEVDELDGWGVVDEPIQKRVNN